MNKQILVYLISLLFLFLLYSCEKLLPPAPAADMLMDAPVKGLTHQQHQIFLEGQDEFDEVYTAETGLGPIFVATSCGGCHAGDSKGHPFTALTRFGQTDSTGNKFLAQGAPQLQHRALPGFIPESLPDGASTSKFIAPITAGVGFLELVSEQDILAMADPNDADADGISGVPSWNKLPAFVTPAQGAITQNGKYLCRFGRKAGNYNLFHQTVAAFNNDLGITTTYMPIDPYNYKQGTNPAPAGDPDVNDRSVNATVFYLQTLQAPLQRDKDNPEVIRGKNVFLQIGCASCHKQTLRTGFSNVESLSNKDFHPYTDLLLHDMGAELNDNYTEGSALATEWRTTPLWGVGLSANAQGGVMYLMHDGRARSFDEAILLHGGEGNGSRTKYKQLSQTDKQALIKFLESL